MCDHGGGDGAGEEKAGGGVGFCFFFSLLFPEPNI